MTVTRFRHRDRQQTVREPDVGKLKQGRIKQERQRIILKIRGPGTIIRARAADVRLCGRATQGVRIMRLAEGSTVVGVCRAEKEEEEIPEDTEFIEETEAPETPSEGGETASAPETDTPAPEENP